MSMTPEQLQAWRWEREIDERNRPLTDEELDAMFPEGYKVRLPPFFFIIINIIICTCRMLLVLCRIVQYFVFLSCSPDLASASRLRAHSHAGPQAVGHSDAHRRHDWLPHAGRGPNHQADERPAVWKPPASQTRRHPVL